MPASPVKSQDKSDKLAEDPEHIPFKSIVEENLKWPTKPVLRCGCSLASACSGTSTAACLSTRWSNLEARTLRMDAARQELDRLSRAAQESLKDLREKPQHDGRDPELESLESGEPSEPPLMRCGPKLQDAGRPGEPPGVKTEWKQATHLQLSKSQVEKLKAGKHLQNPLIKISRQGIDGTFMPFIERRAESLKQLQSPQWRVGVL